jgi:hypothetical protein
MSGICTSCPIALVEARPGGGMDIETYKSELDCVLAVINNGRLGKAVDPRAIGWGSDAHDAAVKHVIEHAQRVAEEIAAQQLRDVEIERQLPQEGDAA